MVLRLCEMGGTKLAVPEERSSTASLNTGGDTWCMRGDIPLQKPEDS